MKKLVVIISGKLRSGKNTVADFLKQELEKEILNQVAIDAFANPLKDMCKEAFQPLTEYLNKLFSSVYEMEGNFCGYDFEKLITLEKNWYEEKTEISRHLLQAVGTGIVRKINPNFWIESFNKRVLERSQIVNIVADVRFPNEIKLVEREFETFLIRVERELDRNGSINEHVSETALDDYKGWDYLIRNDYSLEVLKEQTQLIAKDIIQYVKSFDSK